MSKKSKMGSYEDYFKDLVAARHRLIWAWAEDGATPQQILAKLRRCTYDLKFVTETLAVRPEDAGESIYKELDIATKELASANKISDICAKRVTELEDEVKDLRARQKETAEHINCLTDYRERLEGRLEKYEDSDGKPLVHKERKQRRLIELEKRIDMLEHDVDERLEALETVVTTLQEDVAGFER